MHETLFCLGMFFGFIHLFICFVLHIWFCMRVTFHFLGIIVKQSKKISSTDGSTKRPCFLLQFFRFTVNGHIERDSACLTDQDGSLLYVLCKRNVTKWEYTQVRGSNLLVLNYSNIAFYCQKLFFRSHVQNPICHEV